MIKVTDLVKEIKHFDPNLFTQHKYEEALIDAGHHRTRQGWFNQNGQWLGKTDEQAVRTTAIQHKQVRANQFYALADGEEPTSGNGVVAQFHGVMIWGVYEAG